MNQQEENEKVLLMISNKFNIPYNELIDNIININPNFIKQKQNIQLAVEYNPNKCKAWIINPKTKCKHQCTRQYKIGEFCVKHNELFVSKKLLAGFITQEEIDNINNPKVEEPKIIEEVPKVKVETKIKVQRIVLNSIEYKFDPLSRFVYDFDSNICLGKLDFEGNIIENYKKR
jgi:hypothetical protein